VRPLAGSVLNVRHSRKLHAALSIAGAVRRLIVGIVALPVRICEPVQIDDLGVPDAKDRQVPLNLSLREQG
jgi:hypothetical protein